ncbi:hypothetical protein QTP88_008652 [Uroleucon formosanum]
MKQPIIHLEKINILKTFVYFSIFHTNLTTLELLLNAIISYLSDSFVKLQIYVTTFQKSSIHRVMNEPKLDLVFGILSLFLKRDKQALQRTNKLTYETTNDGR